MGQLRCLVVLVDQGRRAPSAAELAGPEERWPGRQGRVVAAGGTLIRNAMKKITAAAKPSIAESFRSMTQRNEGSNCRGAACQTSRWAGVDECTRPHVFRNGQLAKLVGVPKRLGRAVDRPLAAGAEGAILQAPGSRVTGPAAVMAGHAGSARMRARIAKSRQAGRPCAAVRCAPGSPRSPPASTDSTHKPSPSPAPAFRGIRQPASDSGRVEIRCRRLANGRGQRR
jgi:hypothetical protein